MGNSMKPYYPRLSGHYSVTVLVALDLRHMLKNYKIPLFSQSSPKRDILRSWLTMTMVGVLSVPPTAALYPRPGAPPFPLALVFLTSTPSIVQSRCVKDDGAAFLYASSLGWLSALGEEGAETPSPGVLAGWLGVVGSSRT